MVKDYVDLWLNNVLSLIEYQREKFDKQNIKKTWSMTFD